MVELRYTVVNPPNPKILEMRVRGGQVDGLRKPGKSESVIVEGLFVTANGILKQIGQLLRE
jgi:hypothetical protein